MSKEQVPLTPEQILNAALNYHQHPDVKRTADFIDQRERYASEVQALRTMTLPAVRDACREALIGTLSSTYQVDRRLSVTWVNWLESGQIQTDPVPVAAVQPNPQEAAQPTAQAKPVTPEAVTPTQTTAAQTTPAPAVSRVPNAATPAADPPARPAAVSPTGAKPVATARPAAPAPSSPPKPPADPTTSPENLDRLMQTLTARTGREALATLAMAFRSSGHEHLIGHVSNKAGAAAITNPIGVHGGMMALTNQDRKTALVDARAALQRHVGAGFTVHQIAELTQGFGVGPELIHDLSREARGLTTTQVLAVGAALSAEPGEMRASLTQINTLRQKLGYILEAGHSAQDVLRNAQVLKANEPVLEYLRILLQEPQTRAVQVPPARSTAEQLERYFDTQYSRELNISVRVGALKDRVAYLLTQQHVTRKALLEHINLLHPEITNATLGALYGDRPSKDFSHRIGVIEEFMDTLQERDYEDMRQLSYQQLGESKDQNPITLAVARRVQGLLLKMPEKMDATAARQASLTVSRVTALRSLPKSEEEQLPLNLTQMLALERQVTLLLNEVADRNARRAELLITPQASTAQAREAAVIRNFRRVGSLTVLDVMDILNISEDDARAMLAGMRDVVESQGSYSMKNTRAI